MTKKKDDRKSSSGLDKVRRKNSEREREREGKREREGERVASSLNGEQMNFKGTRQNRHYRYKY